MLTVFQINICANWGSTGRIAEQIGQKAIEAGWGSYIYFGDYHNSSQSQLIKAIGRFPFMYEHYLECLLFDREGLASRIPTLRLIGQLKKIKPDIIHLHNIHDHWINYPILFHYLNNNSIPVVWTLHDFWPITGHCMHFIAKNCTRWKTGCHNCPMQKEFPYSLVDRSKSNWELKKQLIVNNKNLTIVPVSQWVGDVVKQSFLKEKNIHVINNGVDTNVFHPTSFSEVFNLSNNSSLFSELTINKFIIMAVASEWKNGKGLEDYISMSGLLREDELIVLVGVTDDIINRLPSNIVGIKKTTNAQELAAYYSRADVVCSFSSAETFGMTIAEANACGTPVVVYNNTAQPYMVSSNTGYVVANNDYRGAYNAIQEIRKKGKTSYTDSCINLIKKKYDKNQCFADYLELYNSLIKNN